MKKFVLFLLLLAGTANAQFITFPDPNFKTALLTTTFATDLNDDFLPTIDLNSNGEIEFSEAANVSQFWLDNSNINSILGIQWFVNLKGFSLADNNLTTADLQGMNSLTFAALNNNQLTSINAPGLPLLETVDFFGNPNLATIDFSGCTAMESFNSAAMNSLTSLNFNNCSSITSITTNSNTLGYINVDGCIALNNLSVKFSQLSMILLSNLPALQTLQCDGSPNLNNLVIVNCPNIALIGAYSCALTSLDVSQLNLLTTLLCNSNNITTLNYPASVNYLSCQGNNLTSLVVSPNMINLYCDTNFLTTLDLNNSPNLQYVGTEHNNLQAIYAKNGANETLSFGDNPGLLFICADDSQVATIQGQLNTAGMTSTVVNSYCSFVPGGNYNTITGVIKFDANNNGCNASDVPQPLIRMNINDGTNQGASFTNASGIYNFYTQAGNFTITPSVENPTYFNFTPPTATVPFANNNNNTATHNFCISANGIHPDIEVVIEPINFARPGFDATYRIVYKNKGNQTVSGTVTFTYNESVLDFISASIAPTSQSSGTLNWNYTNLLPFESRSHVITLNVNSPTETPPVNIGNILNYNASITPTAGDEQPADNTFTYNQTVVGSYDPNNITCIEGPTVATSQIGNYLHYVINFENTGTFQAENVVVTDFIDTTKYDVNSLQMMNTSHPSYTRVTGNMVEFIFEDINLAATSGNPPVGGHGNILFKIKSKSNLVANDFVTKSAKIYFDYNAPITTNNAQTTFQLLSNSVFESDATVIVHPNPTNGTLTVSSDFIIKSIELYDIQGRLLETDLENATETSIDISAHSNGIYFVKINTEKGSKVEKIIKE